MGLGFVGRSSVGEMRARVAGGAGGGGGGVVCSWRRGFGWAAPPEWGGWQDEWPPVPRLRLRLPPPRRQPRPASTASADPSAADVAESSAPARPLAT